jgi:hypothetical protein
VGYLKSREEIFNNSEIQMKMKTEHTRPVRHSHGSAKRNVKRHKYLHRKEEISNK